MRAGTSSELIRAKTNTRSSGTAAYSSRCFLRFVGADNIPRSQLPQGLMTVRQSPPNARSSGLRPLKWFNLAPQPSTTSSCHYMPLPISAVHHLPPLQSRSGAHVGASLPLRDATPHLSILQPHLGTRRWRQWISCAADVGACYRAASLGVSLWPCKIFIVDVRPRSFSEMASPLVII